MSILSLSFRMASKSCRRRTIRVWDVELLEERGEMDEWQMEWDAEEPWILGPMRERLFWTPLPFQHARNTLVIGDCLKIDFSNFVHGDEWVKCREPLERKVTGGCARDGGDR